MHYGKILAVLAPDAVVTCVFHLGVGSTMARLAPALIAMLAFSLTGAANARLAAWQDELGLRAHLRTLKQTCGNSTGE